MTLPSLRYACIDTETTGLQGRIVDVAVVHLDPGQPPRLAFQARINPGIPIEAGAAAVHGITDADVASAPPWVEIGPLVLAAIGDRIPVAYNAAFDYGRIKEDNERAGLATPPWPWIDPHVPLKAKNLYGDNKLGTVCEDRGIVLEGAHGAACDALALALLWRDMLPTFAASSLPGYLARQRQRALEQEAGYVTWARGKGHRSRPDCPWHVLEGVAPPDWPERPRAMGRCPDCRGPALYRVDAAGAVTLSAVDGQPHLCSRTG